MNKSELKDLLIRSLDKEIDTGEFPEKLEKAGVVFSFGDNFQARVIGKILNSGLPVVRELEFIRNLNYVFYRIALPGVAAIVLLLISLFLMEGSFSLNSVLGLGNGTEESIITLLTGI